MFITICKTDDQCPSSMHDTGHSKPVHWDNPEERDEEGDGRDVRDEGHMYTHADSCQCIAKTTTIL